MFGLWKVLLLFNLLYGSYEFLLIKRDYNIIQLPITFINDIVDELPPNYASKIHKAYFKLEKFITSQHQKIFPKPQYGMEGQNIILLGEILEYQREILLQKNEKLVSKNTNCKCLGTFINQLDLSDVFDNLINLGITSIVKESNTISEISYWVYIAPRVTKRRALKVVERLKDTGIKSFVIEIGELKNGISLGIFSDKNKVNKLLQYMNKTTFTTTIKEVYRYKNEHSIIIKNEQADTVSKEWWDNLLKDRPNLKLRNCKC